VNRDVERELIFALRTIGVQFLGITYDLIDGPTGWALRGVHTKSGKPHLYEVTGDEKATMKFLKEYFETEMYNHMLGYPPNWDVDDWGKK
jgi:hypothetical protein